MSLFPTLILAMLMMCTYLFSNAQSTTPDRSNIVFVQPLPNLDSNIMYEYVIPSTNYSAKGHEEVLGLQFNPVSIALKCQFYFNQPRNETASSFGVYTADWLAQHGNETNDYIVFTYKFPWSPYNLTAGWKSSLAQGRVAECFLKAYTHTHDDKFLTLAKKSLMFLNVPVSRGGVMIDQGNNKWWYELYPSKVNSYVLNGHQFVLLALSKYLDVEDDPTIRKLFDNGLSALKDTALQYDNGVNDSFYDRLGHPALKYHKTHIVNFQRLYEITGDDNWLKIKKVFEE